MQFRAKKIQMKERIVKQSIYITSRTRRHNVTCAHHFSYVLDRAKLCERFTIYNL